MDTTRREFLEFMGLAAGMALGPNALFAAARPALEALAPSTGDQLGLAKGFASRVLLKHGDVINAAGEAFGSDPDFTASIALSKDEALLWVNHETVDPVLTSGYVPGGPRTKAQVDLERKAVGGSIVKIKRSKDGWAPVPNDPLNRRITAETRIKLVAPEAIAGATEAVGTLGNCSGGVTPWKTFLTCEENYDAMYGEIDRAKLAAGTRARVEPSELGWETFYDMPPEHYGWVVEVDPMTGAAKKLTALGRFAHEGAKVVVAKDDRCVVYMGDDAADQCLYKFIAARAGSLEEGTLYVADLKNGRWLPLDRAKDARLAAAFKTQTELLIWTREAARIAGGTPLDRPEGIDVQPRTGAVVVALTNNVKKQNFHGSLLRVDEKGGDPLALELASKTLLAGGPETGFACPDNLLFDPNGDLWMVTDVSEKAMNKGEYLPFGNNSLFYVPMTGAAAGKPVRVATAPVDAEITGLSWAPDGRTLLACVQHPGKRTTDLAQPTSLWPHDGSGRPKGAVVALTGSVLASLA